MFIIQKNNNVIYGPAEYNAAMFKYILIEDCDLQEGTFSVPFKLDSKLVINEEISFLPSRIVYPNLNSKIEQLAGPFWEVTEDEAIGTYEIAEKDINVVKSELKQIVASNRYNFEVKDIEINIQNTDVIIDGSRETKNLFLLNYSIMEESEKINWKFSKSDIFLNLSKVDMFLIVSAFKEQAQKAFDLELEKIQEIDSKETLEELNLIDLDIKISKGIEA